MNTESLIQQIETLLNAYQESNATLPPKIEIVFDEEIETFESDPKDKGKKWKCCVKPNGEVSCKLRPKDFEC